jgi:hypothetical protein
MKLGPLKSDAPSVDTSGTSEVIVSDDDDLYLALLQRVGASEAVVQAAREARTVTNYVPVKQPVRLGSGSASPAAQPRR